MKKQIGIVGLVFLLIALFLFAMGIVSQPVQAESVAGNWTGTCTDETGPANFYYNVILDLTGESSVTGTLSLQCTDVHVNMAGWESTEGMIGQSFTTDVSGTLSGSTLTLSSSDDSGCTYTFYFTVSGNTMTGYSDYVDSAGTQNHWTIDLHTSGGFGGFSASMDISSLAVPAGVVAAVGGSASLAAAFTPGPRMARGGGGRSQTRSVPTIRRGAAMIRRTNQPFFADRRGQRYQQYIATSQTPQAVQTPPPPQQPPLRNPAETLNMPTQRTPTTGPHLVPWDAPQQCPPNANPQDYPYKDGTSASMRCPYCGCTTLSPFTTGWYCTNPLCPARREKLQRGYTHHQYNNMTWRP